MNKTTKQVIVVKLGSSITTTHRGKLDSFRIAQLIKQTTLLVKKGFAVVFVISGAVVCGEKTFSYDSNKRQDRVSKQLAAGVGQAYLTSQLFQLFRSRGLDIAQILLTKDDLRNSVKRENLRRVIKLAINQKAVVVLNENDVVELNSFGGNDFLAKEISLLLACDYLVILTDVDGVYSKDKKVIKEISLSDSLNFGRIQDKKSTNKTGVGGIQSKVLAAKEAAKPGTKVLIANGKSENILVRLILENEQVGTKIIAR